MCCYIVMHRSLECCVIMHVVPIEHSRSVHVYKELYCHFSVGVCNNDSGVCRSSNGKRCRLAE